MKVKFSTENLKSYFITPLEDIKGKLPFSKDIIRQFKKKVQLLLSIDTISDLTQFRSLHFEPLKGNRKGEYSIRLNIQYRLIFSIEKEKNGEYVVEIILVNEISKHYE